MKKVAIFFGVILALFLLAAFFVPFISQKPGLPRIYSEMNSLSVAIAVYKMEFEELPPTHKLGPALLGDNSKSIIFYEQERDEPGPIKDPWGTPYQFAYTSTGTVIIWSAGKDKMFSTQDDYTKETKELTRTSSQ